jgi:hypothetical protein
MTKRDDAQSSHRITVSAHHDAKPVVETRRVCVRGAGNQLEKKLLLTIFFPLMSPVFTLIDRCVTMACIASAALLFRWKMRLNFLEELHILD